MAAIFVCAQFHDSPHPYRVPYPLVAGLFLAGAGFLLVSTLFATPWRALASIVVVASGLPVYLSHVRRKSGWLAD